MDMPSRSTRWKQAWRTERDCRWPQWPEAFRTDAKIPGFGRGFCFSSAFFGIAKNYEAEEQKERGDHEGPHEVEDPVGWAGMAGQLHMKGRFEAPEERGERHGEDPAGRQAQDQRKDQRDCVPDHERPRLQFTWEELASLVRLRTKGLARRSLAARSICFQKPTK